MSVTCASVVIFARRQNRRGFTLIELSVVLVIIGLIVGGIIVGRDLIRTADLRKDIATEQQFVNAINTFQTKYNCLPGDCPNATDYFSGTANGNGNGQIDGLQQAKEFSFASPPDEISLVNEDLAMAGLIPLSPFPLSNAAVYPGVGWLELSCGANCGMFALSYQAVNYVHIGGSPILPGNNPKVVLNGAAGLYSPADAFYIDNKVDDGLPESGSVQSWLSFEAQWTGLNDQGCQGANWDGSALINEYNFTYKPNQIWGMGHAFDPNPCSLLFINAF